MILLAAMIAALGIENAPSTPTSNISVNGTGRIMTVPDVAVIAYAIKGEGRTNDLALSDLVARSAKVESALRSIDPSLDLATEKVIIRAVRGHDCDEERYDLAILSAGQCAVLGYVAQQDFEARTTNVKDAGTMVGAAGRAGASDPEIDKFTLADDSGVRRQAIAAALTDANAKAEAIASASRFRLGEVVAVSMDGGGERSIVVTGSRITRANFPVSNPIAVQLDPEKVETTATVTVVYAIAR